MEFCKGWQTSCTNVKARCNHLLKNGKLTDCTFSVDSQPKRIIFKAHKLILAMASPVFETMFYGSLPETKEIKIEDIKPETFKALLQ